MPNEKNSVIQMQGPLANHTIDEDGNVFIDNEIQKPVDGILTLMDNDRVIRRIDGQLVRSYHHHLAEFPALKELFADDKKPNFVMTNRGGELHMEEIQLTSLQEPFGNYSIDQYAKVYEGHGVVKGKHGFVTLFDENSAPYKISSTLLSLYYIEYSPSYKMRDFMDGDRNLNYSVHLKTGIPILMLSRLDDQVKQISVPALHEVEGGFKYNTQGPRLMIGKVYGEHTLVDLLGGGPIVSLGVLTDIFGIGESVELNSELMVEMNASSPSTTQIGEFTFMPCYNRVVFSTHGKTIGVPLRYFYDLVNKSFAGVETKSLKETIDNSEMSKEEKTAHIKDFMEDLLSWQNL